MAGLPSPGPPSAGGLQQAFKYPSMTSINTMASLGYLPPGHGYVPKKEKPEKPYGLAFTTVLNRTHRGPGRKHLRYALAFGVGAILCFSGAALYLGHRNVSRMLVFRTEVLGALMVVGGVMCVYMTAKCICAARVASNRWRAGIRFRPEGLTTAAAYNEAYVPEDVYGDKLFSGTYGPKALKEIPKPKRGKPKSRARSRDNLDEAGVSAARPMDSVDEVDEAGPFMVEGALHPRGFLPRGPAPRGPPPAGFRPRGPPPPGWRGPRPGGFRPRGPPPPGWRPPPPGWRGPRPGGGGLPPQPQRVPPPGPGPHEMRGFRAPGPPRPSVSPEGAVPSVSESEL